MATGVVQVNTYKERHVVSLGNRAQRQAGVGPGGVAGTDGWWFQQ
jgi:hypothetical protein